MVKGVNRQVLEIHDTETEYFEKALLFVKPEYSNLSEKSLRESFVGAFGKTEVPRARRSSNISLVFAALRLVGAALLGALITFLILK